MIRYFRGAGTAYSGSAGGGPPQAAEDGQGTAFTPSGPPLWCQYPSPVWISTLWSCWLPGPGVSGEGRGPVADTPTF